jgi:predicted Rossmann fold flavoprotein
MVYDLIVIGGGAAGFFGAVQTAEINSTFRILILEKTSKLLSKVKVSGGGRCNVTHHCFDAIKLSHHYPRGEKSLRTIFKIFDAKQTVDWFSAKDVSLKVEEDGRMFPLSNDSQTIINCLMKAAHLHKIEIEIGDGVVKVDTNEKQFQVLTQKGKSYFATHILIATGGSPSVEAYRWIESLGHTVISPIPSLFTFNDKEKLFVELMGISVPNAEVKISGTKFLERGPLLITHWGLSGPAVIKLSAWSAAYLHERNYQFIALVSWIGSVKEDELRTILLEQKNSKGKQKIFNNPMFALPQRLWIKLCQLSEIEEQKLWGDASQKSINRLIEFLIRCPFQIKGKTTFKEEFVTCGGVDMQEIDLETMQSKKVKNMYFAGEVLNIDGETGGFNFQAAWSTAFVAARSIASSQPMNQKE